MPILATLLAAAIPMLIYLYFIWRMDIYEREPLKYVLKHFGWGAFGAIILALIGNTILSLQFGLFIKDQASLTLLESILIAPLVEESTKGIYLAKTVDSRKFDNLTDGLVYGGAIGLGFGMTENFMYFLTYGNTLEAWIGLVIIRSGFTAIMHCISTATLGAFLGMAILSRSKFKFLLPVVGLISAMFIHFLWNFSVSFESTYMLGYLFLVIILIMFLTMFRYSIKTEEKIILFELKEEVLSSLIPNNHLEILASKMRKRKGWIDESIRKAYIKAATRLAFRKYQFKHTSGSKRVFYGKDIETTREFIRALLNPPEKSIIEN